MDNMKETIHEMPDGKQLIIREDNPDVSELLIRSTARTVKVGKLTKSTGILVVFKNRDKHEHHRTKSYGFNAWLMHNSTKIKTIHIYEEYNGYSNEYKISRQALIDGGHEMDFIVERQIFYPIRNLETFHKL